MNSRAASCECDGARRKLEFGCFLYLANAEGIMKSETGRSDLTAPPYADVIDVTLTYGGQANSQVTILIEQGDATGGKHADTSWNSSLAAWDWTATNTNSSIMVGGGVSEIEIYQSQIIIIGGSAPVKLTLNLYLWADSEVVTNKSGFTFSFLNLTLTGASTDPTLTVVLSDNDKNTGTLSKSQPKIYLPWKYGT